MQKYKFNGFSNGVKPEVIAKSLLDIKGKYGDLMLDNVWKEAINSKHPLHPCFTWDKDKAAKKLWAQEAGYLIRNLLVLDEKTGKYNRAFLNIMRDLNNELTTNPYAVEESTYIDMSEVMNLPEIRDYSLKRAFLEMESFQKKYKNFAELVGVIKEIEKVLLKKDKIIKNKKKELAV